MNVIISWTTISTSVYMMIAYFNITTGAAWVLGIAAAVVALIRSPILSLLIDNSKREGNKFKSFLFVSVMVSSIIFTLIPFIPNAWNGIQILKFTIPAIPIMGVYEPSEVTFSLAIVVMFIMVQIGTFFSTLLTQSMTGIEQTISRVSQERANICAIRGLICNIPSSIVNVIIPILAGSVFANVGLGGYNSIEMYRWIFPFCAAGAISFIFFTIKGTKERVVVKKPSFPKLSF